jgi:hypothetical protein
MTEPGGKFPLWKGRVLEATGHCNAQEQAIVDGRYLKYFQALISLQAETIEVMGRER